MLVDEAQALAFARGQDVDSGHDALEAYNIS
jgi:hypothetical protein